MAKTTTKTSVVNLQRWFYFDIKANQEGHTVELVRGDGDIWTGKGGKVYADLEANIVAEGSCARIDYTYEVWNDSNKGNDLLRMKHSLRLNLNDYNKYEKWTNGNKTYEMRMSYTILNPGTAYYRAWYKSDKSRTSYLDVNPNDYPTYNKPQSWLPIEHLQFKVDGSGSECTSLGNLAFKMRGYVPVQVTRTLTIYEAEPLIDKKAVITNLDAKATTIDQMMLYRDYTPIEDGFNDAKYISVPENEGETGAWLRGVRDPQKGIENFNLAKNTGLSFYCGQVVKVDEDFFEGKPRGINFYENERKPLDYICSLHKYGMRNQFDGIIPSAKNVNRTLNEYTEKYRSKIASEAKLPQNIEITHKVYDSSNGISLGGTIKGVSFNIGKTNSKFVQVFELRQKLFEVALDDTFKKASDYFTNSLNLPEFKKQLGHYNAAIINRVDYGKIAYIAFVSKNKSAHQITISDFNGSIGGKVEDCQIYAFAVGGATTAGDVPSGYNKDTIKDFIKQFAKTMDGHEVEACVPIGYQACYLGKPEVTVKLNLNKYYQKYVETVKIKIQENNSGASMSGTLRFIDKVRDNRNAVNYAFVDKGKNKFDFTRELSPWACCIELKVDVVADDSKDFNVFVPYIPLHLLNQDSDGDWMFKINVGGSTIYNTKDNVTLSHPVPGAYLSKSNGVYRGGLPEYSYSGRSEEYILTDYFNWCEMKYKTRNDFVHLTSEKTVKISRD